MCGKGRGVYGGIIELQMEIFRSRPPTRIFSVPFSFLANETSNRPLKPQPEMLVAQLGSTGCDTSDTTKVGHPFDFVIFKGIALALLKTGHHLVSTLCYCPCGFVSLLTVGPTHIFLTGSWDFGNVRLSRKQRLRFEGNPAPKTRLKGTMFLKESPPFNMRAFLTVAFYFTGLLIILPVSIRPAKRKTSHKWCQKCC